LDLRIGDALVDVSKNLGDEIARQVESVGGSIWNLNVRHKAEWVLHETMKSLLMKWARSFIIENVPLKTKYFTSCGMKCGR